MKRLYAVRAAGRRLGYTDGWIRYLADVGALRAVRTTTGQRLFTERALEEFEQRRRAKGTEREVAVR